MSNIGDNVKAVLERIDSAAVKAGRDPAEIALVAATKMNDAERVQEAIKAGITICGENRVQEMEEKLAQNAYQGSELHFIGHLQKNKVRFVTGSCKLIQSVDSVQLMEMISNRAVGMGIVQDILIEINIGGEEAKSGITVCSADELIAQAAGFPGINVRGIMCIPPVSENISETCNYFRQMFNLFVDIKGKKYDNVSMSILSMGMSSDYAEAIAQGANMVRVGSAIFGMRHYHI